MTPQDRARKSANLMFASDSASRGLGMAITDIGPGHAVLQMKVRADIFTLADSAFAFACNSYNQLVVAQQNQITYVAPGQEGELLTATATETSRTGRSGVYDVTVTGEDGRTVALFRGLSRTIKGQHFDEEGTPA